MSNRKLEGEYKNIALPGIGRIFKRRFKRHGAVYESSNWSYAICHRGKERSWSSGSDRESVARKLLIKKHEEISRRGFAGLTEDKLTFENLAQDFINDYHINGKKFRCFGEAFSEPSQNFFWYG